MYSTSSLPKSHPDFKSFTLSITPAHGLCTIVAMGQVINTSAYGTELINAFETIESSLTSKYGTPKQLNYLKQGSIWHEPNEWMMSLLKKERVLTSYWKDEFQKLPDNLEGIEINTHGLLHGKSILSIKYQFTNKNECVNWIKSQVNSSL